jgi:hypothetical protein
MRDSNPASARITNTAFHAGRHHVGRFFRAGQLRCGGHGACDLLAGTERPRGGPYPAYFVDSERKPLDGATGRYTVRFRSGQLPPVNAFWSLTMYELPASLLTANPINRYLINSPMEPDLIRDPDGGVTLHIQHQSPRKDKEPNWLPAPKDPSLWCSASIGRSRRRWTVHGKCRKLCASPSDMGNVTRVNQLEAVR